MRCLALITASVLAVTATVFAGPGSTTALPTAVGSARGAWSPNRDDQLGALVGEWRGEALVPGSPVYVQARILPTVDAANATDAAGPPTVVLSIPRLGVFATEAKQVEVQDGELVVSHPAAGLVVELRIRPGDPPRATLSFPNGPPQVTALAPTAFDLVPVPELRSAESASRHDGELVIPGGGLLPITVVFAEIDGVEHGLVDIPAQGVQGLVLLPVAIDDASVAREPLAAEPGARCWRLPVPVEATLVVVPDGDSWRGRFAQGPLALDIEFARAADAAVPASRRPQDPMPPLPYDEIEVQIPTPAGHVLAGTLALPPQAAADPVPAVVLVTGSGPQNRDEELMGHRPFRVLADRLARAGIASLRYDDRGIAGSTGEFATATTFEFADDAAAALAFLQRQDGVDPARCGLAGHSEGGAVVAIVAAGMAPLVPETSPAFIVSIAGAGVSGDRVLADQLARIYRASGVDEATIEEIRGLQARVLTAMVADEIDRDELRDAMRALQEAQVAMQGGELDDDMRASLEAAGIAEMSSPWMRRFVRFDPAEAFARVEVPVLAVNGTLDLQVWHDLNLPAIERAVREAGGRVTVVRLEGLNHMLQPATTGGIDEYAAIDLTMDEDAMALIANWILEQPAVAADRSAE